MTLLARFDGVSQQLLLQFLRKVALFVGFAAFVSMLLTHSLALIAVLLQTQCLVSGGFSIAVAIAARQRVGGESLTYWDEALALSGLGLLSHLANRFVQSLS